jgi:hypothetical protein
MTRHIATCSCGSLKVHCNGEPVRVSICHCTECQRRTGSAFSANARFAVSAVTVEGKSQRFVRTGDSGKSLTFHFCPGCGSTLWWTLESVPDVVAVAVGAFADPGFPAPRVSVYESRKLPWVSLPDTITHHLA